MAPPFPAQGGQHPYTERPYKVYGEQYTAGGALPVGAVATVLEPLFPNGEPRVYAANGRTYVLADGDWVLTNRYTGQPIDVISDEEFTERFGGGGGPPTLETT